MRYLVYETGVGKTANMEVFDHLVGLPTHPGVYGREAGTARVPSLSSGKRFQLFYIHSRKMEAEFDANQFSHNLGCSPD